MEGAMASGMRSCMEGKGGEGGSILLHKGEIQLGFAK